MSDKSPIQQGQCDGYREDVYAAIQRLETMIAETDKAVAGIEGEKRFARYIMPLILVVLMGIGGIAMTSIIKNTVREAVKEEIKGLNKNPAATSMLMSKYP